MVIPIVAMLAVTMVVAGYYQREDDDKEELEIEKGSDELTIEYFPFEGEIDGRNYNKNSNATTLVNQNNTLNLEVEVWDVKAGSLYQYVDLKVRGEGNFEEDFEPEILELRAQGRDEENASYNSHTFSQDRNWLETVNCSIKYDEDYTSSGNSGVEPAKLGADIESNRFFAESRFQWSIPDRNWYEPYTLELQAILHGLSEEVTASIDLSIDVYSKVQSMEVETDKEHYYTSDYTSEEDAEENRYYVEPKFFYEFENLHVEEDHLYDVKISLRSDEGWETFYEGKDKIVNTSYEADFPLEVDEGAEQQEYQVRYTIISQESGWEYDSLEDLEISFYVTEDGGG